MKNYTLLFIVNSEKRQRMYLQQKSLLLHQTFYVFFLFPLSLTLFFLFLLFCFFALYSTYKNTTISIQTHCLMLLCCLATSDREHCVLNSTTIIINIHACRERQTKMRELNKKVKGIVNATDCVYISLLLLHELELILTNILMSL